jgi:cellulose biosynthesis protein BcsQ
MIYAVVNTKAGVGETTTAVHLATMLARALLARQAIVPVGTS